MFGKYGYDGLSVDQYCLQAKISKGSFFQYFPSKTHLLEFTLLLFDERLKTFVSEIRKSDNKVLARDRLQYLLTRVASKTGFDETEKKFYLFALNALHHSAVTVEGISIGRHLIAYVDEIIKRGLETGEIRADIPLATTAATVAGAFNSMLSVCFLNDEQPNEVTVRSFTSILFDGISA